MKCRGPLSNLFYLRYKVLVLYIHITLSFPWKITSVFVLNEIKTHSKTYWNNKDVQISLLFLIPPYSIQFYGEVILPTLQYCSHFPLFPVTKFSRNFKFRGKRAKLLFPVLLSFLFLIWFIFIGHAKCVAVG